MAKKKAEQDFGETKTEEAKPAHCSVCGAVFGTCDHTKEKKAENLPATVEHKVSTEQLAEIALSRPRTYPPIITAALVEITRKIPIIDKAGTNTFHKYNYAKSEDVIAGVRDLLLDHGIILMQEQKPGGARSGNGVYVIDYWFTFLHVSGETYPPMEWSGACKIVDSKGVADDKAVPKCHTQAEKYFLIKQFKIRVQDLPDSDGDTDGDKVPDNVKGTTRDPAQELPVEPHKIIADPGTAQNWQRLFLVAIRRASTAAEVGAWSEANLSQMEKLKERAPALHTAAYEAILRRYRELAEVAQPPSTAQSAGPQAQTTTTATSAEPARVAKPLPPRADGIMNPMEEETYLEGWNKMLANCKAKPEAEALLKNILDKIKDRLSGIGYSKALYSYQVRCKQIESGAISEGEGTWDFDSWFRTDLLGALSACEEGDTVGLDRVRDKVVNPMRSRMSEEQWKQTRAKFLMEATRIKGDDL